MTFSYPVDKNIFAIDFLRAFNLGRSRIYTLFQTKKILRNGFALKEKDLLLKGDTVQIVEDAEIDFKPERKKLNILYEDDYLLIINKPTHLIVHPDDKSKTGSLCGIVAYYYKNKGYNIPVRYAHRLDEDTTGIIIFCKDMLTMAYMNYKISTHEVKRVYRALVKGHFKDKIGVIDLPIGEDRHHNKRRRVSKTGEEAITHYAVIREYKDYSLLELKLETGRTHQIRVHMSHMGHPLLGDELYGGDLTLINRTALHSYYLEFVHPVTKEVISLTQKIPFDMEKLIKL